MKSINVIGCGKVGSTLARLWTEHRVFAVRSVLNRSLESGRRAAEFIGGGRALAGFHELDRADVVMIAASDESIEPCCRRLCATEALSPGAVVFHVSGALASSVLAPARARGASIAAVHPVKSFADPRLAVETFAGTFCALEGDGPACDLLRDAIERCGGRSFAVDPQFKTIYHAATVFVSNYLVALVETGLRCFEKAGVQRETALEVMGPLVRGTVDNVFRLGPIRALTGPIARGEVAVVAGQSTALERWDDQVAELYRALGRVALDVAAAQGNVSPEALAAVRKLLGSAGR